MSTRDILRGKPSIKGTRLRVRLILGYLAAGHTAEEIMADLLNLKKEQIAVCLDDPRALEEFEMPWQWVYDSSPTTASPLQS
jgi:uncharacterized protein (DUF433 family)